MAKRAANTIDYDQVERSLRNRDFAPLYFFSGDEDLLVDEAVDLLIRSALDDAARQFNLDVVYGSEISAGEIVAVASSFPMMSERRVVIVREFDKLSNKDALIPYIERPVPSTSLVLIAARPDFRVKIFKLLAEKATTVEFRRLYENEIPPWISKRMERTGKAISPEAAELIPAYVGRSLREIQNEIEKLVIYVGDRQSVSVEDVNAIVGMSKQFNVFELQNAVGARNLARAQEIMEHMHDTGEGVTGIVIMLTKYFQKLWLIQDCLERKVPKQEIAAALRLSPKQLYFLENELRTAKAISREEIERSFRALVEADERLKTSGGEEKMAMTLLLHQLFFREPKPGFGPSGERAFEAVAGTFRTGR